MRMFIRRLASTAGALALALGLSIGPADAKTFRWANDGDVNSLDPYSRNETFLLSFLLNVYEPLVRRKPDMSIEASLATQWERIEPTVWRFKLRQGVKFHDGSPFSADDVVFSIQRGKVGGSNMKGVIASIKEARKVDDFTVDLVTHNIDPILPDEIVNYMIMSKTWAEKNNATVPADLTKREETFATRNANGTGPFRVKLREPDVRTVLDVNPAWWDQKQHNIDEVVFTVIANDATRVAALLSGEIDMMYTVPPQDTDRIAAAPGLRILQRPELRTIFLGMDQLRPELVESSVKGKNPFKDIKVRQAFYMAIDNQLIRDRVMRGFAAPTGLLVGDGVRGFNPAMNTRLAPVDPDAARKLLTEAGYPNGFELTLDCPNDRYVNDERICQAVVGMLARIGVKVSLNAQTRAKFFAKVNAPAFNTGFYLLGWTPATVDTHDALLNLLHCREGAAGQYNIGGYCNKAVDKLVGEIQVETDAGKRQAMIDSAMKMMRDDFAYIPLHQQVVVWAGKQGIDIPQRPDNYLQIFRVKMN